MAFAPALALVGTAVSGATAAATGIQSALAARAQSRYAEGLANYYSELGQRNARAAIGDAQANEARYRRDSARRIAAFQTRVSGGSGATLTGTPLAMLGDAVAEAEEQALLIRHAGKLDAQAARFGSAFQSMQYMTMAGTARANVGQSLLSGFGSAAGAGMSGMASAYGYGYRPGAGNDIRM